MAVPNLYKATGIILKRTNYGEGDKIITVFCEHIGKKRFVGKGIRKITSRRSGHTELFSKTVFLIHRGKSLDYVTGATVEVNYGSFFTELGQLAVAYTACELIDKLLMEGQIHDDLYFLIDRLFTDMKCLSEKECALLLKNFIDEVLTALGFRLRETKSSSLGNALAAAERVMERKIKSTNLLYKAGAL